MTDIHFACATLFQSNDAMFNKSTISCDLNFKVVAVSSKHRGGIIIYPHLNITHIYAEQTLATFYLQHFTLVRRIVGNMKRIS